MTKIGKIGAVLAVIAISVPIVPVFALAENASSSGKGVLKRVEKKAEAVERKVEKTEDRVEKKVENKLEKRSASDEKKVNLIKKFTENMLRVHLAAVNRLDKLADRMASRIAKIEAEKGINLDSAEAKLLVARTKLSTAGTYLDGVMAQVESATGTPAQVKQFTNGLFATSRENLKVAHQSLVDVISSIKLGLGISATATTTP